MSLGRRLRSLYGKKDPAEAFFRKAAKTQGLSYHAWCQKNGVVDEAAAHRAERWDGGIGVGQVNRGPVAMAPPSDGNEWGIAPDAWAKELNNTQEFSAPSESAARRRSNGAAEAAD